MAMINGFEFCGINLGLTQPYISMITHNLKHELSLNMYPHQSIKQVNFLQMKAINNTNTSYFHQEFMHHNG